MRYDVCLRLYDKDHIPWDVNTIKEFYDEDEAIEFAETHDFAEDIKKWKEFYPHQSVCIEMRDDSYDEDEFIDIVYERELI